MQTGHCLGSVKRASDRFDQAKTSNVDTLFIRCVLHATMFGSALSNEARVSSSSFLNS
jgi:hypothetical protein